MNNVKLVLGLFILLTIYSCGPKEINANDKFHGMWQLDKFEAYDNLTNTWTDDSTRLGWNGYILYDGIGHMGVHLTPKGYQDFKSNKNIDSLNHDDLIPLAKFYKSNFVYFANYILHENTIVHNRLSATEPSNWGKPFTRDFEFRKDTLILTAHEIIDGQKIRLRWIKSK